MKKYIKWILELWFVYLIILQISLLFLLNKIDVKLETSIKFYGLILQVIGSIIIVYILYDKLILFREFGLSKFFADYLSRFPGRRIKINVGLMAGTGDITFTGFAPHIGSRPKEDFKDIIRYYDEQIDNLHKRMTKSIEEKNKQINDLNDKIEELHRRLGDEIKKTNKRISDSSISNIGLDLYGVSTAGIGIICATIPEIIVRLF